MVYPNIMPPSVAASLSSSSASPHPPRVEYLATLSKHQAPVNVVRFSPNGDYNILCVAARRTNALSRGITRVSWWWWVNAFRQSYHDASDVEACNAAFIDSTQPHWPVKMHPREGPFSFFWNAFMLFYQVGSCDPWSRRWEDSLDLHFKIFRTIRQ